MSDVNTTVSMSEICELREAEILDGQTLTIDGTNGGIAAITCRHLREAKKQSWCQLSGRFVHG